MKAELRQTWAEMKEGGKEAGDKDDYTFLMNCVSFVLAIGLLVTVIEICQFFIGLF